MSVLILLNANVITLDPAMPRSKAVAVRDGVIVEVSPNGRLAFPAGAGATRIDCEGKTVLPGFIDPHCHIASYAESLVTLDLSHHEDGASIPRIQKRLAAFAANTPVGTWIRGKGYNEFHLPEKRHPSRWELDAVTPHHPVKLTHRSGHAHVLNSLGLELVGITAETGDPPGGLIDRDLVTGEPTGLLFGMAGYLAGRIPSIGESEMERGLRLASTRLLSYGVTSVQDASAHNGLHHWERFAKWKADGIFGPRLSMMMGINAFTSSEDQPWPVDTSKGLVRIRGVKIIVHQVTGGIRPSQDELDVAVTRIHRAGRQVAIHAVDEETIEAACTAIERALRKAPRPDHRHRIEHCSVCPPLQMQRVRDLRITIVTQPPFIYYSGDRYLATVPEQEQSYLYPVGSMVREGIAVAASSDCPVADPNPFVGVFAAVTRKTRSGRKLLPREAIRRSEAIRMYTLSAAAASGEEKLKGTISLGKMADLVVLSEDPFAVDEKGIRGIKCEMTIMGGSVVWSRIG
jgi:predicted amidohydrolase YtcJ